MFWKIQDRRQLKNTENTQIKYNSKKQTMQIQENKTTLVQSPFTTLGQETRWAYSITLQRRHEATE